MTPELIKCSGPETPIQEKYLLQDQVIRLLILILLVIALQSVATDAAVAQAQEATHDTSQRAVDEPTAEAAGGCADVNKEPISDFVVRGYNKYIQQLTNEMSALRSGVPLTAIVSLDKNVDISGEDCQETTGAVIAAASNVLFLPITTESAAPVEDPGAQASQEITQAAADAGITFDTSLYVDSTLIASPIGGNVGHTAAFLLRKIAERRADAERFLETAQQYLSANLWETLITKIGYFQILGNASPDYEAMVEWVDTGVGGVFFTVPKVSHNSGEQLMAWNLTQMFSMLEGGTNASRPQDYNVETFYESRLLITHYQNLLAMKEWVAGGGLGYAPAQNDIEALERTLHTPARMVAGNGILAMTDGVPDSPYWQLLQAVTAKDLNELLTPSELLAFAGLDLKALSFLSPINPNTGEVENNDAARKIVGAHQQLTQLGHYPTQERWKSSGLSYAAVDTTALNPTGKYYSLVILAQMLYVNTWANGYTITSERCEQNPITRLVLHRGENAGELVDAPMTGYDDRAVALYLNMNEPVQVLDFATGTRVPVLLQQGDTVEVTLRGGSVINDIRVEETVTFEWELK